MRIPFLPFELHFHDNSTVERELRGLIKKKSQSLKNRLFFRHQISMALFAINFVRLHAKRNSGAFAQKLATDTPFLTETAALFAISPPERPKKLNFYNNFDFLLFSATENAQWERKGSSLKFSPLHLTRK